MSIIKRPSFWLKVKKTYITENFEDLVDFLQKCSHLSDEPYLKDDSSDFGQTFIYLKELVYDYMNEFENDCIYTYEETEWNSISAKVRTMVTYLLSAQIRELCDYKVLAKIVDLLLLTEGCSTKESISRLKNIIFHCIAGSKIIQYGLSWNDVQSWEKLSVDGICYKLGGTTFASYSDVEFGHEGRGCVVLQNGELHISPMNLHDYGKETKIVPQFNPYPGLILDVIKGEQHQVKSFAELKEVCKGIQLNQENVHPSPAANKKKYSVDDMVVTVITGYHDFGIVVRSIDTKYETVSGKVYIGKNIKDSSFGS